MSDTTFSEDGEIDTFTVPTSPVRRDVSLSLFIFVAVRTDRSPCHERSDH